MHTVAERLSRYVREVLHEGGYGKVATQGDANMIDAEEDGGSDDDCHHTQRTVLRMRKPVAAASIMLLLLLGVSRAAYRPASSVVSAPAKLPASPTPPLESELTLKHRRGVHCATSPGTESVATNGACWTPAQMAAKARASGYCFFGVREHISIKSSTCAQTMHPCLQPLRLVASAGFGVYSACPDADPMASSVSSSASRLETDAANVLVPSHAQPHGTWRAHSTSSTQLFLPASSPSPPPVQLPRPSPATPPSAPPSNFVSVSRGGRSFERNGQPFSFLGTTMWYAAHLATRGPAGNRDRLTRELDSLQRLGVRTVRVLASSEGTSETPYHVVPAIQPSPGVYARDMLEGLDWLMKELSSRRMFAILILANGMPWSGGMAQYVAWATHTRSPFSMMRTDWEAYERFRNHFYQLEEAKAAFDAYVSQVLQRRNAFTGAYYKSDPNIMAWEIANEPRDKVIVPEYQQWVRRVGRLIRSIDKNHLIGLGSDGTGGLMPFNNDYDVPEVDYAQVNLWPERYGWHKPADPKGVANTISRALSFLDTHVAWSEQLAKPLVVGAMTLSRDLAALDPAAATTQRDTFFEAVFRQVDSLIHSRRGVGGISFWGWSGEATPRMVAQAASVEGASAGSTVSSSKLGWKAGEPMMGDPPSEKQGRFAVYATDSTCDVIQKYAGRINAPAV